MSKLLYLYKIPVDFCFIFADDKLMRKTIRSLFLVHYNNFDCQICLLFNFIVSVYNEHEYSCGYNIFNIFIT